MHVNNCSAHAQTQHPLSHAYGKHMHNVHNMYNVHVHNVQCVCGACHPVSGHPHVREVAWPAQAPTQHMCVSPSVTAVCQFALLNALRLSS